MTAPATCPTCRSAIPPDSPDGACPRCMLAAGLVAATVPTADEVAAKLPAFEILSVLGQGGMGVVFKARQRTLDRVVALKVLPSAAAASPGFAERFAREAKAMARLQHPNIVAVHDSGESDGLFWLVMEYVDGVNIREAMRAGRIAPKEALAIVPQICDALQYAHEHGVVHRDIKPENVLLDKTGRVKVADFGLAKLMETTPSDRTLTDANQVMGTPHYMAPEQVEHPADVDHRADIYSLGVVFYEMLTGELPLGRFAAPSGKCDVDARIDEIVMRTLAKEREARYQQVAQVKTDMGKAATEPPAKERPKRWREFLPLSPADQAMEDRVREGVVGGFLVLVGLNSWISNHRPLPLLVLPTVAAVLLAIARFWQLPVALDAAEATATWRRRRRTTYWLAAAAVVAGAVWALVAPGVSENGQIAACGLGLWALVLVLGLFRRWNMTLIVVGILLHVFLWTLYVNLSRPKDAPLLSPEAAARLSPDDFRAEDDNGLAIDLPREQRKEIDALWREAQRLPATVDLDAVATLYCDQALESIRKMSAGDRARAAAEGHYDGVPLLPRSALPRPLSEFHLDVVRIPNFGDETAPDIGFGRASAAGVTIRFFLERDGEFGEDAKLKFKPWRFGSWAAVDK